MLAHDLVYPLVVRTHSPWPKPILKSFQFRRLPRLDLAQHHLHVLDLPVMVPVELDNLAGHANVVCWISNYN